MANSKLKIGMIGLDASHAVTFTELLHDDEHPFHVQGGTVVAAFPGGSADFELSYSRVEDITEKMRDQFNVQIVQSPEAVAELSDAILIVSVDGRVHLEQLLQVAPYGKPIFVNKPFTVHSGEAQEIFEIANKHNISLMSCSSLRYAEGLTQAVSDMERGQVIGMDCYGPMAIQPTQPGLFWYGIHTVEMLFSVLGPNCLHVVTTTTDDHDVVVGTWADGRIGTIRGNRKGNNQFGALLHREQGSHWIDVDAHQKSYYASLLEKIMEMFNGAAPDIQPEETIQIIRFIEAANESRLTNNIVKL